MCLARTIKEPPFRVVVIVVAACALGTLVATRKSSLVTTALVVLHLIACNVIARMAHGAHAKRARRDVLASIRAQVHHSLGELDRRSRSLKESRRTGMHGWHSVERRGPNRRWVAGRLIIAMQELSHRHLRRSRSQGRLDKAVTATGDPPGGAPDHLDATRSTSGLRAARCERCPLPAIALLVPRRSRRNRRGPSGRPAT